MIPLGFSEELEQVAGRHELHNDVDRVVVNAHPKHSHDVGVVEVAAVSHKERIRTFTYILDKYIHNLGHSH